MLRYLNDSEAHFFCAYDFEKLNTDAYMLLHEAQRVVPRK